MSLMVLIRNYRRINYYQIIINSLLIRHNEDNNFEFDLFLLKFKFNIIKDVLIN